MHKKKFVLGTCCKLKWKENFFYNFKFMNINFRILVEKLTGGVTNGIYFKRGCFNYYNFMHSNLFSYIFIFSFCH